MTARSRAAARYVDAAPRLLDVNWRRASFCALDLETTGLDTSSDEIVSFAAVPVEAGRVRMAGTCSHFVRPRQAIPGSSIRIHGIRPIDVRDAPPLGDVIEELLEAMTGRILLVHVDWVERGFLAGPLHDLGIKLQEPVLDTARLARACMQDVAAESLYAVSRRLGLPGYGVHEALGDALTTAQVFLALASRLEASGVGTVAQLSRVGSARGVRGRLARLRRSSV